MMQRCVALKSVLRIVPCNITGNGDGNEKGKKKTISLIRKKNNFAREAHFFVHFFAVVLICRMCASLLFFSSLPPIFTLVPAANISHFLNAAIFIQQNSSPLFFYLSLQRFLCYSHQTEKRLGFDSCQQTFLACMFCFPNLDHVIFSRECAFGLFINHAYICTWMHVRRTTFERNSSVGYIMWSEMGKQNKQAKTVYSSSCGRRL